MYKPVPVSVHAQEGKKPDRTGPLNPSHVSLPSENIGLADDDFDKCFWFVTALVFVVKSWKGEKPAILAGDLSDLQLSPDGAMENSC